MTLKRSWRILTEDEYQAGMIGGLSFAALLLASWGASKLWWTDGAARFFISAFVGSALVNAFFLGRYTADRRGDR